MKILLYHQHLVQSANLIEGRLLLLDSESPSPGMNCVSLGRWCPRETWGQRGQVRDWGLGIGYWGLVVFCLTAVWRLGVSGVNRRGGCSRKPPEKD